MSETSVGYPSLLDAQSLCRTGRFEEAARLFRDFLRIYPKHLTALHWLGLVYFRTGQFERAQETMVRALQLDPDFIDGLRIRGLSLMQLARYTDAVSCFERALSLAPHNIEVLVNYGVALLQLTRPSDALVSFDRALPLDNKNATAWTNRGSALIALERYSDAVVCFDRALAIQPNFEAARRYGFLVRLKLRTVNRIADFAVREMFDDVADQFDTMMVDELGYRAHLDARELANRVLPRQSSWRILDLGCGTGLVGKAFKDLAAGGRLDGIDLASRMLEVARSQGVYDDLVLGDLESVLFTPGRSYDLIVSADTMIYLGCLRRAFTGVARWLETGGFYIFTCEAKPGTGWEFHNANRFSHSEAYLREEAATAGLGFVAIEETILRQEKSLPVAGFAVALRKPSL